MTSERITLGAQMGGPEAFDVTQPIILRLRKQLASHCTEAYSPTISEFAIILRIDGSLDQFGGEGVQRPRINRKDAYVTADYAVPVEHWKDVPLPDLKKCFAEAAVKTVDTMVEHLKKLKVEVNAKMLAEDVNKAVTAFLKEASVPG